MGKIAAIILSLFCSWSAFSQADFVTLATEPRVAGGGCSVDSGTWKASWRFDDNLNDSKGSHNLTDHNTITYDTGKIGNASSFNGGTQYADVADHTDFSVNQVDITIWGWFYLADTGNNRAIIAKTGEYYLLVDSNNKVSFVFEGSGSGAITTESMSSGQWYFVVASWTNDGGGVGTLRVQIDNGTVYSQGSRNGFQDNGNSFKVGAYDGSGTFSWNGRLDEINVYRGILTSQQITDLYNSGNGCRP